MPTKIKVTLTKSPIGQEKTQRRTVESLGLHRMHQSRLHENNPQIRGMIHKVAHLVSIEPVTVEG
jgi:large subunit ribosomal protein L30